MRSSVHFKYTIIRHLRCLEEVSKPSPRFYLVSPCWQCSLASISPAISAHVNDLAAVFAWRASASAFQAGLQWQVCASDAVLRCSSRRPSRAVRLTGNRSRWPKECRMRKEPAAISGRLGPRARGHHAEQANRHRWSKKEVWLYVPSPFRSFSIGFYCNKITGNPDWIRKKQIVILN